MHAYASLTAFPVFAVEQPRERNRTNRSRSQFIMECYAVEVDFALIYAAFREYKSLRRYLICPPLKITSYCVTERRKKQRADHLLSSQLSVCTCLSALVISCCEYFLISVKLNFLAFLYLLPRRQNGSVCLDRHT